MSNENPINLIPVSTNSAISQISPNVLPDASNVDPIFEQNEGCLLVSCTVAVPSNLDPTTEVAVKQYYDPKNAEVINFYIDLESNNSNCTVDTVFQFNALGTCGEERIDLSAIENIEILVLNKIPVSSRNVVSTVKR